MKCCWAGPLLLISLLFSSSLLAKGLPECNTGMFPCKAILIFDKNLNKGQQKALVPGGKHFPRVNAGARVIANAKQWLALLANPGIREVLPDREITVSKPAGKGGNGNKKPGGTSGQVTPSGLTNIGWPLEPVPEAEPGATGAGVGIVIGDTGLDFSHLDLKDNVYLACFDAFGGNCGDQHGHGTHVAGISSALNNEIDIVGVAPDATLFAVRMLDHTGSGSDSQLMDGLQWILDWIAADKASDIDNEIPDIKIVNLSLGRPGDVGDNPALHTYFKLLYQENVSVVVAAGNDASVTVSEQIPAAYPETLAVGATTAIDGNNKCRGYQGVIGADTRSHFSTYGPGVTISAPGEQKEDINRGCFIRSSGILSLNLGGGTIRKEGTSIASPYVAGALALLYQNCPGLTPAQVKSKLQNSARGQGDLPIASPSSAYTLDEIKEGVLSLPGLLAPGC